MSSTVPNEFGNGFGHFEYQLKYCSCDSNGSTSNSSQEEDFDTFSGRGTINSIGQPSSSVSKSKKYHPSNRNKATNKSGENNNSHSFLPPCQTRSSVKTNPTATLIPDCASSSGRKKDGTKILSGNHKMTSLVNMTSLMTMTSSDDNADSSDESDHLDFYHGHAGTCLTESSKLKRASSGRNQGTRLKQELDDRDLALLQLDDSVQDVKNPSGKSKDRISASAQKVRQTMGETCSDFCKIANFTLQREDFPEKGLIIEKFQCKNNHLLTHLCERQISISIEGAPNSLNDPFSDFNSNLPPNQSNHTNQSGHPQGSSVAHSTVSRTSSLSSSSSTSSLSEPSSVLKSHSKTAANCSKHSRCENKKPTKQQYGANAGCRNNQKNRTVTSQSKYSASQSQKTRSIPSVPDLGLFHV